MGRKSTIDLLPENVRDDLLGWLEDPAIDIDTAHDRVNALLDELGLAELKVSRAAVGRKAQTHRAEIERIGAEMREAKASRELFYERFGSDLADGGKFLAETLQGFIFKMNLTLHQIGSIEPEEIHEYAKTVKNMTGSIVQLEEALTKYTKREAEIKRAATEAAAEAAEQAMQQSGLSAESVQRIKNEILGVRA